MSLPEAGAVPVLLRELVNGQLALLLPLPADTAAAVLRRGDALYAIFDSQVPLELMALRQDPFFGGAESRMIPGGVMLRLPIAAPAELLAQRVGDGWLLVPQRPEERAEDFVAPRPLAMEFQPGPPPRLAMLTARPGRTLTLTDPETGLPLLVAPLRQHGEAIAVARRLPQFEILPTTLGAALLARADNLAMQAGHDRFLLAGAGGAALALDADAVAPPSESRAMTRLFDLPAMSRAQLLERLKAQQGAIAMAPPLGRSVLRRDAAETLVSLGLPQEAQAMLSLALTEDPRAAEDAASQALGAVAALLGGRLAEARGLLAETLPESDELALWRAVLAALQGEGAAAAPALVATLPLMLDYPAGLKARLLQPVAEALAEARQGAALQRLLAAAGDAPNLGLARAMLAEAEGKLDDAIRLYAEVEAGRDRLARARATRRSVELRLASGKLDAAAAAQALDAALFAWRGDSLEWLTRRRIAELRRQAGDARNAMTLLRETIMLFPEQADALQPDLLASFRLALEKEPPLAAIALFDANPELRPEGEEGEAVVALLAERLLALDLPDRAMALLRQAMTQARTPAQQARLGLLLAQATLSEGNAAGALQVVRGLPGDIADQALRRDLTILEARAEARRGDLAKAATLLRALDGAADNQLAELLAEAQDWVGAAAAQGRYITATLPAAPAPLAQDHRRTLLRQAALLALAGDEPALAALRLGWLGRMRGGELADAFDILTNEGLRGLADLPRLQQELQLFRALPGRLEALRNGGPVTR